MVGACYEGGPYVYCETLYGFACVDVRFVSFNLLLGVEVCVSPFVGGGVGHCVTEVVFFGDPSHFDFVSGSMGKDFGGYVF